MIKFNKMEELFNKWLESKDTTENIINHLKGQKSFHLDFLKYVTEQCNIPVVSNSYSKEDLRVAFEQARCNKHSFEDWYEFNYC